MPDPLPDPLSHQGTLKIIIIILWPHPQHMEVPRLGVESELQLPANTTVTATRDLNLSATYTTAHGNAGLLTH